ncbi:MAG: tyrosine-type recombinase/integrase [Clostridiales bacterium]|nr:tyrosine-type recombinase/integrase [Clostridiales bacterium]
MTFESRLNDGFEQMMAYRASIGYATATYRSSVPPFINFCVLNYPGAKSITQDMVNQWLSHYPYSDNGRAVFLSLLREYTKFLCFLGHDDYIPDDDYTVIRTAYNPFLFTDSELFSLFDALDRYRGDTSGKRLLPEMVLPVYSRMLYCCGMRPQEPPALLKKDIDLSVMTSLSYLPYPPQRLRTKLPTVWTEEQIEAIVHAVDTTTPVGKRDYAIVLLGARLGLRIGDILKLTLNDIDWNKKQLSIIQSKTREPLTLPLPEDVGWAVIDYLKNGRPIVSDE